MDVSTTYSDSIGNVKLHHTFNGAAPIGRGWMVCNGNVINQTNYDAVHGAGAYVRDGVANSPLVGKTLPNMDNKFAVGTTATTQTGSGTIPSTGLTGHTLTVPAHNHQWYDSNGLTAGDSSYNSSGVGTALTAIAKNAGHTHIMVAATNDTSLPDAYTSNNGAVSQSIKPESIEFLYIICVI